MSPAPGGGPGDEGEGDPEGEAGDEGEAEGEPGDEGAPGAEGAPPGTLWVVATPIGNLGDLTPRAASALREASRVLAEDTRRTRALLSHLGITGKPLERFDAHAPPGLVRSLVARLVAGERLALVTDAGTPAVSDPGARLVAAAAEAGARVVPLPGASAVLAALAASGFGQGAFRFVGFLPRSGEARRRALAALGAAAEPVVLFEAPGRLRATLGELAARQPGRPAVVGRELTKRYEEFVRGTLAELAALERAWRGEISLVLGPAPEGEGEAPLAGEGLDALIDEALARGLKAKEAADVVAARSGLSRREAYARVLARKATPR
ncbi:MAG TPA: 16S rRNA (cytidine(1402)-2'-O)-methyltransferase [Polyangiaceae bacterium]|nr:16S rRNA (cytidine(1402)-2'-O)-methyltransferase [Polyangiaceae bacterium]